MEVIAVHVERCIGCKTCELTCATERGSEAKTLLAAVHEAAKPQARLRVEGANGISMPVQCRHCLDAPCLDACLTGALQRNAQGLVEVKHDLCIGCWTCVMFCPYGAIFPWPDHKLALKCDRCAHMEEPACVDVCPTQALELIDPAACDDAYRERRRSAVALAGDARMADASNSLVALELTE